jgi:hypothetical protein
MPQGKQDRTCSAFSLTFARRFLIEILKFAMYVPTVIMATTSDVMNFSRSGIALIHKRHFRAILRHCGRRHDPSDEFFAPLEELLQQNEKSLCHNMSGIA